MSSLLTARFLPALPLALLLVSLLTGSLPASAWTNPTTTPSGVGGGALTISSGRVGIGTTTSLTEKFEVAGTLRLQGSDAVYKATTVNGKTHHLIGTYSGWDTDAVYIAGYNVVTPENGNSSNSSTRRVYIGRPERLAIDLVSGNVGIGTGTASPSSRLTVAGDIAVTTQGRGLILQSADGSSCSRLVTNSAGAIILSGVNCATGVAVPTTSSPPQSLTAAGSSAQVILNWSAPQTNGGSAITSYRIYRGTNYFSQSFIGTTAGLTLTDAGLAVGTSYYYRVSAVNGVGESLSSAIASATTLLAFPPSAPQNMSAIGGLNQVTLSWGAPSSNGGSAITSYRIYRGTYAGGETLVATSTSPQYTSTGLTNGVTYFFKVSAVTAAGEGAFSSTVSAVTGSLPGAPGPISLSWLPYSICYANLNLMTWGQGVRISWSPPASSGTSPILYYKLSSLTTTGGATPYYDYYFGGCYSAYHMGYYDYMTSCYYNDYWTVGPFSVSAVTAVGEGPATTSTWATSTSCGIFPGSDEVGNDN